jgi:hypothetical protein
MHKLYIFLVFPVENTIWTESEGLKIKVPHPPASGLHKLIISERRKTEEKLAKEKLEALNVLNALIRQGESNQIIAIFNRMPLSWRGKVLNVLNESVGKEIINILE